MVDDMKYEILCYHGSTEIQHLTQWQWSHYVNHCYPQTPTMTHAFMHESYYRGIPPMPACLPMTTLLVCVLSKCNDQIKIR